MDKPEPVTAKDVVTWRSPRRHAVPGGAWSAPPTPREARREQIVGMLLLNGCVGAFTGGFLALDATRGGAMAIATATALAALAWLIGRAAPRAARLAMACALWAVPASACVVIAIDFATHAPPAEMWLDFLPWLLGTIALAIVATLYDRRRRKRRAT